MFVHFKHDFKASSAGVSCYRGFNKCLCCMTCAITRLLQLSDIACHSKDALSDTNESRAHRFASPDLFIQA